MQAIARLARAAFSATLAFAATVAYAQGYPGQKEGTYVARDFRFNTGETMAELRLHYTTLGNPAGESVMLLHGTTGSGARRKDILSQFMIEAVILSQIGGAAGVALGILGGNAIGLYLEVPAVMPWDWVAIGLGVCSCVGLLFGVYPAWKASTLDPIESLRYE